MSAPTIPKHHIRKEVCVTRPAYREGRLEKAVKVYTVNQESKYLLVQGVPAVGGVEELVKLFAVYGAIEEYRILDDYPAEEFTEVYLFKFKKIQFARWLLYGNRSQPAYQGTGFESSEHQGEINSVSFDKLWLPPPPVDRGPSGFRPPAHSRYEYAWVQSSHATLPSNYDGRTDQSESLAWSRDPGVQGQRNDQNMDRFDQQTKDSNEESKEKKVDKPKSGEKVVNGLIVREYKKTGKVPKFIPRQALKKTGVTVGESPKPRPESDALNKQIRVNAFTLADTQGPTMPGKGDQTVKVHPGAQKAVNQTVKDIRKRISKFIAEKVPQQKKAKES
ncbi:LOW QUALITY PROTEIN: uncharacterized protein LOC124260868 [Haliotis rubra]|uniref:LOW QUALITY PROTEIN: uncharacterized protein LOC124260868 n=1 Tax=Haliotis rubra TaxID=36100 RepID=UPI001EE5A493|nr:LOW QUALITY PROTEIN: uncharacterized protein LOC124260868 [Haliotis rubra]